MAPAAVKAWVQVLSLLQKKQQHAQRQPEQTDSPAARKLSHEIDVVLAFLEGTQSIPRAAWKTIIKDMEVSQFNSFYRVCVGGGGLASACKWHIHCSCRCPA
jgi:hypothetical protein